MIWETHLNIYTGRKSVFCPKDVDFSVVFKDNRNSYVAAQPSKVGGLLHEPVLPCHQRSHLSKRSRGHGGVNLCVELLSNYCCVELLLRRITVVELLLPDCKFVN